MPSCGRVRPPDIAKLKALGDIQGLIQALGHEEDSTIRRAAEEALLEIGARAVAPLIRALLKAHRDLRPAISAALEKMGEDVVQPLLFHFEQQEVTVHDFSSAGCILDIGGGGEGVIGKLKGERVIAIDPSRRELEEAAAGPLKIIMDARELRFLDDTFNTVTSFFTLMYIKGPDHEKVFSEVFRVLAPGGLLLIWDVIFPKRLDEQKDIAVFPLLVKLPDEEISTGYGAPWPDEEQDLLCYLHLAGKAGFRVVEQRENERVLFLKLQKP